MQLSAIFDHDDHPLKTPVAEWLKRSRRFAAFVEAHQTKIRKKLRTNTHPETIGDLQLELETAFLLLRSDALHLTYEPGHPKHGRSADFAVRYTTSITFMAEVTRMRPQSPDQLRGRIAGTLTDKLGQLRPNCGNIILVGIESSKPSAQELRNMMGQAKRTFEGGDENIEQHQGSKHRSLLLKQYQRLSAILIREIPLQVHAPISLWTNPEARYPLPAKVLTALMNSHSLG